MPSARPSVTARWVAAHRARMEHTRPSTPGADLEGERRLYRDVGGSFAVPLGRPKGMAERTRVVDAEVARAIGRGTTQVVLLGAGYDGRALRFGVGSVRWFEVDLPATQADKRRRLDALGVGHAAVSYLPLDLATGDLDAALDAAGHDRGAPSLFVCEGLLASLTLGAAASLCETLRARAPDGSVLVASFLVSPVPGTPARAVRAATDALAEDGRRTPAPRVPARGPGEAHGRHRMARDAFGVVGGEQDRRGLAHVDPRVRAGAGALRRQLPAPVGAIVLRRMSGRVIGAPHPDPGTDHQCDEEQPVGVRQRDQPTRGPAKATPGPCGTHQVGAAQNSTATASVYHSP